MRFDFVDLRLFVAIAALGNLTKAAEGFPIALAAASARIKALEESVGARLFERSSRGVSLTPAGDIVNPAGKLARRIIPRFFSMI